MVDLTPQSGIVASRPYLSATRADAMVSEVALCTAGVFQLIAAAAPTPLSPFLAVSGGLTVSGCVALALPILLPIVNDKEIESLDIIRDVSSPSVFLVPFGVMLGGREAVKPTLEYGGHVIDLFTFVPEKSFNPRDIGKFLYLLRPDKVPDYYLLARELFPNFFKGLFSKLFSDDEEKDLKSGGGDDDSGSDGQSSPRDIPDLRPPGDPDSAGSFSNSDNGDDFDGGGGEEVGDQGYGMMMGRY